MIKFKISILFFAERDLKNFQLFSWQNSANFDRWTISVGLLLPVMLLSRGVQVKSKQNAFSQIWPWPVTYDLDLQVQPTLGQVELPCKKSRSKVKRFQQESARKTRCLEMVWKVQFELKYYQFSLHCKPIYKNLNCINHDTMNRLMYFLKKFVQFWMIYLGITWKNCNFP